LNRPNGEARKATWPWDVYKASDGSVPASATRYEHTTIPIIALFVTVISVVFLASSARPIETEMLVDVRAAKQAGFPQLPPGHATSEQIDVFIEAWNLNAPGSPPRREIDALSVRVGEYEVDSLLYFLGIYRGAFLFGTCVQSGVEQPARSWA
jgi:hypothetical protein